MRATRLGWAAGLAPLGARWARAEEPAEPSRARVSRLMLPDDANPAGNVHGGTILQMIEQAGFLAASRHGKGETTSMLARIEHMDFAKPMFIGNLADVEARLTFASDRSVEVCVDVNAEDLRTGDRRHTNAARLWYVSVDAGQAAEVARQRVPQKLACAPVGKLRLDAVDQRQGAERYEAQKRLRQERRADAAEAAQGEGRDATLAHLVLPQDCTPGGIMVGGALMKLMDSAAGVAASRHCRSNVVTVCIDALDLQAPAFRGNVVRLCARPTFASGRSLEIEVTVVAADASGKEWPVASGLMTFVSLAPSGKPLPIPPLEVEPGSAAAARFAAGEARYLRRKAQRR